MRKVAVVGAGMTRFGKWMDKSLKDLGREAVEAAMKEAGVDKPQIEAAIVGNATAGLITGQEMIRAQVILREMGFGDIPMINTENACASSSTAFHLAWMYVASGMYDVRPRARRREALPRGQDALVPGHRLRRRHEAIARADEGDRRARHATPAKTRRRRLRRRREALDVHGLLRRRRPRAHEAPRHDGDPVREGRGEVAPERARSTRTPSTARPTRVEDIMASPMVAEPLTRLMCSPIGDGAAALILCSEEKARQLTTKPVWVTASVLGSGKDRAPGEPGVTTRMAQQGVRDRRRRPRRPRRHRAARRLRARRADRVRGAGSVQGRRGRPAHRRRRDRARRQDAREPERRPAVEGPPDRRDGLRAAHGDLLAAPRRRRRPPGEGRQGEGRTHPERRRHDARRSRRHDRPHPRGVMKVVGFAKLSVGRDAIEPCAS